MDKPEKVFADGIYYEPHNAKAPDYILDGVSIEVEKFIAFLQKNKNGDYCRLTRKLSKGGKSYYELNTWKPNKPQSLKSESEKAIEVEENQAKLNNDGIEYPEEQINPEDIPF